ncbi:MAG: AAA family ATPase [Thiomargarita sp.]|nr:AAA family ATPase [Thiomargarita sp.]
MNIVPNSYSTLRCVFSYNTPYIDKTREIYQLITGSEYVFLSRPRRFGKSLLVSTLYEIFSGKKALFKGLFIYDKIEWQSYPIIHIDFSVIDYSSGTDLREGLIQLMNGINSEFQLGVDKRGFKSYFNHIIRALNEKYGFEAKVF